MPPSKGGKWGNWLVWGVMSKDGKLLASAGKDVIIWDVGTGKPLRSLEGHANIAWEVALSADGKACVTGWADKTIRVWRVEDGQCLKVIQQADEIRAVAISPDGRILAVGG